MYYNVFNKAYAMCIRYKCSVILQTSNYVDDVCTKVGESRLKEVERPGILSRCSWQPMYEC